MMSKNSCSLSSLNTQEALILGNPPDHLFNPSLSSSSNLSSSLSSTLSSALSSTHEIDSKKQSHQTKEQQRGRGEERELQFMGSWRLKVKSSSSIVKGRSAIKKRRKRSSIIKRLSNRKKKEMMDLDRDFELMPPPGSHKKNVLATVDVDQPIDPNEPYCICNQVALGDMIGCDNDDCQGGEWFHYSCVGLTPETRFKGKWYCPTCKLQNLQIATLYCEQGNCIGVRAARVQVNGTEEGEASC